MSNFYPHGPKSGWLEQAEKIVSGEIQATPSDIPMLIEWLKDMNWPGAEIIARYLPSFGHALIPHVERVLRSGDLIWIHWVLGALRDAFDENFWFPSKDDLERVGFKWDPENAHIESLYILARCKFMSQERLRLVVEKIKLSEEVDLEDYYEIDALLGE